MGVYAPPPLSLWIVPLSAWDRVDCFELSLGESGTEETCCDEEGTVRSDRLDAELTAESVGMVVVVGAEQANL